MALARQRVASKMAEQDQNAMPAMPRLAAKSGGEENYTSTGATADKNPSMAPVADGSRDYNPALDGDFNFGLTSSDNPFNRTDSAYWSGNDRNTQAGRDSAYQDWLWNSDSTDAKNIRGFQTPLAGLQYKVKKDARDFRGNLENEKMNQQGLLKRDADVAVGEGTQGIRKGANDRGLLYGGIREGQESSLKGKVAGLLSRQIAGSNAELESKADAKDAAVTQMNLTNYQAFLDKQAEADSQSIQNSIARAQQMQQLTSAVGYAAGSYVGSAGSSTSGGGQRSTMNSNRNYMSNESF